MYPEISQEDNGGSRSFSRAYVEGLFSSVTRLFGESVQSSSKEGMLQEARMKFNCYNMLVSMVE